MKNILSILTLILTLILVMPSIFAVSISDTSTFWTDGVNDLGNSIINDGEEAQFHVYVYGYDPYSVNIVLRDLQGNQVGNTILDITGEESSFIGDYIVNKNIYGGVGNYRVHILADDGYSPDSKVLSLTVNEVVLPENSPPVITSTPVTEVDEGADYSYQVTATDADAGDTLIYSLTQEPEWLSINSAGLITGTAPEVVSDIDYDISVEVSDGTDIDTQSYTLTVKNLVVDTTAPTITISYPVDGAVYTSHVTVIQIDGISDPEGNLDTCWYSLDGGQTSQTFDCGTEFVNGISSVEGENNWIIYANDTLGNEASESITFSVDLSVPDTTPPEVSITYPVDGATYTSHITTMLFDISDAEGNLDSCWYSIDNGVTNQTMDCALGCVDITSVEGANTWAVYAKDTYGNENSASVTFTVDPSVPDTTSPTITILFPENKEYTDDEVFFEVMTDETSVVVMSLDGGTNITMNDGSGLKFWHTLTVSDGSHEVVFYATDGSGNVGTNSIAFSVDTSEEKKEGTRDQRSSVNYYEEDEYQYLSQFEYIPPIIDLTEDEPADKPSLLGKVWEAIVDFFKRLFGLNKNVI